MASSSSSLASNQSSTTTTTVSAIDMNNKIDKKKEHETMILHQHDIFLREEDFSLLVQSGLIDQLVRVFEAADREKRKLESTVNNMNGDNENNNDGHTKKKMKRDTNTTTDISTQTGPDFYHIFIDPNAREDEVEIEFGYTYMTRSFYNEKRELL